MFQRALTSGSTSFASLRASEFARSWLAGVTARMMQLSLVMCCYGSDMEMEKTGDGEEGWEKCVQSNPDNKQGTQTQKAKAIPACLCVCVCARACVCVLLSLSSSLYLEDHVANENFNVPRLVPHGDLGQPRQIHQCQVQHCTQAQTQTRTQRRRYTHKRTGAQSSSRANVKKDCTGSVMRRSWVYRTTARFFSSSSWFLFSLRSPAQTYRVASRL